MVLDFTGENFSIDNRKNEKREVLPVHQDNLTTWVGHTVYMKIKLKNERETSTRNFPEMKHF